MSQAPLSSRNVERLVRGQPASDGAGVKLQRVLTQDLQQRLDPFLMLDSFSSDRPEDYGAGFPDHPHRGFETITYMIAGRMRHKDSTGNEGLITNGGIQWMTAGRGVVHSEMPEQESGVMEGFQLWLNLPAKSKMCTPWYKDVQSDGIPQVVQPDGTLVRVIAGHYQGTAGAVQREDTYPVYLDVHLPQGKLFEYELDAQFNAFVYPYRGSLAVGEKTDVPTGFMAILDNTGKGVRVRATQTSRFLLIAGRPLREPIAQYGPFVMNTRQELMTAFEDFQSGRFGR
jgi:quercetin 2,3-dioxygenase